MIGQLSNIMIVAMATQPLYKDATQPISVRASDLLKLMTLEEKVAQLLQPWETKSPSQVFQQSSNCIQS